jgi:signal transduction histidine kinase
MTQKQPTNYTPRLHRLLEVCKNLTANLELVPLLSTIVDVASDVTQSEFTLIMAYDAESARLNVFAAPFLLLESLKQEDVPVKTSLAGHVVETLQLMVYHESEKPESHSKIISWEKHQKATSVLAVPLLYKGEAVGVIEVFNKVEKSAYNAQDIDFLEVLAAQAAAAIQNHRLIQKSEQSIQKMLELDSMKNDFIAISSHELRTPLGLIMGHASLLKDKATEEQKADIEVIAKSASRMKDMIEEFGDMEAFTSGMKRIKRERVLIDILVRGVVENLRVMADENKVRLTCEIKQPNLSVEGDNEKLSLGLHHLVKNALQFTNPGGVAKVTAEPLPGFVKLTVIDNGIGIPAEEQKKIFNRFYQAENHLTRRHGGMGLGLSAAKEMIEMHGGKIWVESVEGKGSRFTVLLPLNAAQASAAQRVFLGE